MDFTKFFLVFKREYFSRLKSKTFIVTTILAPVGFLLLFLIPIAVSSLSSERERTVYVVDETGSIDHRLVEANPGLYRIPDTTDMDELRGEVMARKVDAYVYISESVITNTGAPELVYGGAGGLMFIQGIRSDIQAAVRNELLDRSDVNPEVREIFSKRVGLQTSKLTETGEEETDTTALFIVGLVFGIVIYAAMFIYGAIIMRSVIEEKSSRIIEVITSAVKPLELLLGKVIGVGALGMTQFLIWIVAISGIGSVAGCSCSEPPRMPPPAKHLNRPRQAVSASASRKSALNSGSACSSFSCWAISSTAPCSQRSVRQWSQRPTASSSPCPFPSPSLSPCC
jgi:ABC-2 type transport system permease protein